MATSCGSPCYAAPELVVSEGLYVGSAVDIWSCGVILFAMLSGYLPYDDDPSNPDGDNINLLYRYIINTRLNFPDHMSPAAKHLLQIMLVPDPERRCKISDIMQHPWLAAYTQLFARSPSDHEHVFQQTMFEKSQLAKRELSERRRIQEEAKAFKAMQRSQSSAPGASITASMLDHNRRRDQRGQSALPTMPASMQLKDGGSRTPPLSASYTAPIGAAFKPSIPASVPAPLPLGAPLAEIPPFSVPKPTLQPLATGDQPRKPVLVSSVSETPPPSTGAVENESIETHAIPDERPVTPPPHPEAEKKEPMSANKNRHTIQVEYDIEASYERMQESMRGSPQSKVGAPEAATMNLQPVTSDIEMDSGSEQDHKTEESLMERISPEASHVTTPPLGINTIPEGDLPTTPTRNKSSDPTSPTTPRASAAILDEETVLTPRQKKPIEADTTPRPPVEPFTAKRRETMPPTALLDSSTLDASGLPVPAKRERSRKGMSLDKFGLARLLGQVRATDDKSTPPSAFGQSSNHVKRGSTSRPSTASGDPKTDKKAKRRTVQLVER
jgi:protein-serine/threonine kinase